MEKVGGWEKNHDVEAFSPVFQKSIDFDNLFEGSQGDQVDPGLYDLPVYPFHFWPLVKELHGNWSNILNNQGPFNNSPFLNHKLCWFVGETSQILF